MLLYKEVLEKYINKISRKTYLKILKNTKKIGGGGGSIHSSES